MASETDEHALRLLGILLNYIRRSSTSTEISQIFNETVIKQEDLQVVEKIMQTMLEEIAEHTTPDYVRKAKSVEILINFAALSVCSSESRERVWSLIRQYSGSDQSLSNFLQSIESEQPMPIILETLNTINEFLKTRNFKDSYAGKHVFITSRAASMIRELNSGVRALSTTDFASQIMDIEHYMHKVEEYMAAQFGPENIFHSTLGFGTEEAQENLEESANAENEHDHVQLLDFAHIKINYLTKFDYLAKLSRGAKTSTEMISSFHALFTRNLSGYAGSGSISQSCADLSADCADASLLNDSSSAVGRMILHRNIVKALFDFDEEDRLLNQTLEAFTTLSML